jgi:capsular polysaccharide biosynthesis protein
VNDDPDRAMRWSNGNGIGDYLPERLWTIKDFTAVQEPPAAAPGGALVSLGFIKSYVKRRKRLWFATAAAGLLLGCGLYVTSPVSYQASTSVLLIPGPYENINTAPNNDQAMAQTRTVAGLAVRELGLRESPGSFLGTYKVTPITERVIAFTASAPSSSQAVRYTAAVASAFLKFRAQELQTEQDLVLASLNDQVRQARQHLSSINSQIGQLSGQPGPSSQLKSLQAERTKVEGTLYNLQQSALGNQTTNGSATAAAVKGSVVLDPATALVRPRLKPLVLDAVGGLVVGLLLGLAIVVIQALVSDKLRRRDDVAQALGSPVRLSVGAARQSRWLPGGRGGPAVGDADVQRIVAHLGSVVPGNVRGSAALVVVPIDDLKLPATCLVSLATSLAQQGKHVVVADLTGGAPAARLLGVADPGVRTVNVQDTTLVVAVPESDDLTPVGPFGGRAASAQRSPFAEAVTTAWASANLLLTLATFDPALGGEHVATWATDSVAVVTAGRSSWTRIQAVGEMVRLSGMRLVSAVLVGADEADESLGIVRTPETV